MKRQNASFYLVVIILERVAPVELSNLFEDFECLVNALEGKQVGWRLRKEPAASHAECLKQIPNQHYVEPVIADDPEVEDCGEVRHLVEEPEKRGHARLVLLRYQLEQVEEASGGDDGASRSVHERGTDHDGQRLVEHYGGVAEELDKVGPGEDYFAAVDIGKARSPG